MKNKKFLVAKKVGMSQIIDDSGRLYLLQLSRRMRMKLRFRRLKGML